MKKIGLIGGTGPESTLLYYKEINRLVDEKTSGKQFPEMVIESLNLYKAVGYCKDKDYDGLEEYLMEKLNNLLNSKADFACLTAATMHIVYDRIKDKSPLKLISIPEVVSKFAEEKGYKRIGLIGTIFTMCNDYMKTPFLEKGIEIYTPNEKDILLVNERISSELEYGIIKESTRKYLIEVIERMKQVDRIEAIILGCTELPLILNDDTCPIPCLDIVKLHIDELVELILSKD